MVEPSFFTDGELWEGLPDWGLLFYIGCWCEAEDSGCLVAHAGTLKNRCLPGRENIKAADVQKVLTALEELGKLQAYEVGGKRYYWLVNFHKYQRIDYPTPPRLPLPDWITWHGEEQYASGTKGEEGYKSNRRKWHYQVH